MATAKSINTRDISAEELQSIMPKHYVINRNGTISNKKKGIVLSGSITRAGYLRYTISIINRRFRICAHRAVALKYIPNPDSLPVVNHKDGNKLNNDISNLEWCTHAENVQHAYDHCGKKPNKTGLGKFSINHHGSKKLKQLSLDGSLVKIWNCAADVKRETGLNRGNICSCARGELKSAYGYKWEYA